MRNITLRNQDGTKMFQASVDAQSMSRINKEKVGFSLDYSLTGKAFIEWIALHCKGTVNVLCTYDQFDILEELFIEDGHLIYEDDDGFNFNCLINNNKLDFKPKIVVNTGSEILEGSLSIIQAE